LLDTILGKGVADKLLNFIKLFSGFLLRKWWVLLIGMVAGGAYGLWKVKQEKIQYLATTSFVLTTESINGANRLSGLAAQLGLDFGGSTNDNAFTGDNIIELFKSNRIITRVLFHPVENKKQPLINCIIDKQYKDSSADKKKYFPVSADNLSIEDTKRLRSFILSVSKSFVVFKKDKKLSIYYITTTYPDEEIAFLLNKILVAETSAYFLDTKTQVAQRSLRLIQNRADSLNNVILNLYSENAEAVDKLYNMNQGLQVQRAPSQYKQAKLQALSASFTEVMRNLEIAKITVQKEMPLFQIIDEPVLPLAIQEIRSKYIIAKYILAATAVVLFFVTGMFF